MPLYSLPLLGKSKYENTNSIINLTPPVSEGKIGTLPYFIVDK